MKISILQGSLTGGKSIFKGPLHIYYGIYVSVLMGFLSVRMGESLFIVPSLEIFLLFVLLNSDVLTFVSSYILSYKKNWIRVLTWWFERSLNCSDTVFCTNKLSTHSPPKRALMIYRKEIRDRNKQKVARGGENKKQSKKSEIIISRDSAYRPVDSGATGTPRKG